MLNKSLLLGLGLGILAAKTARRNPGELEEAERYARSHPDDREAQEKVIRLRARTPGGALKRWRDIVAAFESYTWDTPVETSDHLTSEERDKIISLGYYGRPVEAQHAEMIARGERYTTGHRYTVHYLGGDGNDSTHFDNLEDAATYVGDRLDEGRRTGDRSFRTNYALYKLEGFTMDDIAPLITPEPEDSPEPDDPELDDFDPEYDDILNEQRAERDSEMRQDFPDSF